MIIKTFFTCIFALSASVATAQTAPDLQAYCLKQKNGSGRPPFVLLEVTDQKMTITGIPFGSWVSKEERNSEVGYGTEFDEVEYSPGFGIYSALRNTVPAAKTDVEVAIYDSKEFKLAVTIINANLKASSLAFDTYLCRNKIRTFD